MLALCVLPVMLNEVKNKSRGVEVSFDHVLKFTFVAINARSQGDEAFVSMYIRISSQLWWNNLYRQCLTIAHSFLEATHFSRHLTVGHCTAPLKQKQSECLAWRQLVGVFLNRHSPSMHPDFFKPTKSLNFKTPSPNLIYEFSSAQLQADRFQPLIWRNHTTFITFHFVSLYLDRLPCLFILYWK